jgi:hypothetical protein
MAVTELDGDGCPPSMVDRPGGPMRAPTRWKMCGPMKVGVASATAWRAMIEVAVGRGCGGNA